MILHDNPRIELLYANDNIIIPVRKDQVPKLMEFMHTVQNLDLSKDYTVKVEEVRRKRSLDANAYFWTLVGKLGAKLYKPDSEIYREIIKDCGVYEIIPVKEAALQKWMEVWEQRGLGWVCLDMGECRNLAGYHYTKCYYGSSVYDTKQMSRLIDTIIDECKLQGIETLPPAEIKRMMEEW